MNPLGGNQRVIRRPGICPGIEAKLIHVYPGIDTGLESSKVYVLSILVLRLVKTRILSSPRASTYFISVIWQLGYSDSILFLHSTPHFIWCVLFLSLLPFSVLIKKAKL